MLSIESGLITCGDRIIVPREMRPQMLQYIHEGHQGKERCLLRARNTVFWPKMTYDIQQLIEKCVICQEYGKSQPLIGTTQELPPFPWHTLATDLFYWKRMNFLIVVDVFSKYIIVRKLPNSTSAAVCIELCMIVTELGLPHIIRSDNGPCYNSRVPTVFAMLQHHTPNQQPKLCGAEQPKVYRHTRTMLKIRSTPTEGEQTAQMKEWTTETRSIKSNVPAIPYGTRDCVTGNSQGYASSNTV